MRLLLTLLIMLSSVPAISAENQTLDRAIDSLVEALRDTDAAEHRKARQVHYVSGKNEIALVLFTIEGFNGGNNYTSYLAAFEPSWAFDRSKGKAQQRNADDIRKYRLVGYSPIGGKGWRSVDFTNISVEKRQVTLPTKEYVSGDPMCCPSKNGTAIYKVENRQLVEVKPD
jgi:hypothetical protein